VRVRYLQDKFRPPSDSTRPWFFELSGRVLSLATDIKDKADRAAQKLSTATRTFTFHDVAYGSVPGGIRGFSNHGNLAVYVEPLRGMADEDDNDPAHANLVILHEPPPIEYQGHGADAKPSHDIYRQIATLLETCDAVDLGPLEALRRAG
jgi:hypothetical protein